MGRGRVATTRISKTKTSLMSIQILLVDDDSTSLSIISAMLKRWSDKDGRLELSIVTIKSPVDALATLRVQQKGFDLVLTDLHMPQMNGLELQKQVGEEFKLPVIIMSSDDCESVISRSLQGGALFYIVKPVNPGNLKNVWQYAVAAKRSKSVITKEIGSTQGASSSSSSAGKVSRGKEADSASSGDEERCNKTDVTRKGKKRTKQDEEDNNVAPKKTKVVWTNSLHNRFLQAINHIGLEKAVPKRILEFMNVPGLSRENVASHLQKYRIFLKRVAEESTVSSSQNLPATVMRSALACGRPLLTFNNVGQDHSQFSGQQQRNAPLQPGFVGNFSVLANSNFGPISIPNQQAPGGNPMPQFSHSMSHSYANSNNFQPPMPGNANPLYQTNQMSFSCGHGGTLPCGRMDDPNGLPNGSASLELYPQQNQGRSNIHTVGNPCSYQFASTGSRGSNCIQSIGSTGIADNNYTLTNAKKTYAGIRMRGDGNLVGAGQMGLINRTELSRGPNGAYDMMNLIHQNNGIHDNVAPTEDGGFSSLAQEASFAGFDSGNQLPPSFATTNQVNNSTVPPQAPQQNGLRNGIENNYAPQGPVPNGPSSTFGSISDQQQRFCQTDFDAIFQEPANNLPPHQQQIGERIPNACFTNISHHEEVNTPLGELLTNPDFMSSFRVEDDAMWNVQAPSQPQTNPNFCGNSNTMNDYCPNFVQQQGQEELVNPNPCGAHMVENAIENQCWDDDFLDSIFANEAHFKE